MEVKLFPSSQDPTLPDQKLNSSNFCRSSGQEERGEVRLLPRPLPGHHLHHQDTQADPLLLLQPDRSLHPDRQHGGAGLHPPPGLWREVITRYKKTLCLCLSVQCRNCYQLNWIEFVEVFPARLKTQKALNDITGF